MKKPHSRARLAGGWLLFWTLFIGIGALSGSTCMLIEPDGSLLHMEGMLPYFQVLPLAELLYRDYTFPGFALLIVNGLTNLTAAYLLLRRRRCGVVLGGVFGITLMLWICIQFVIFPMNPLSTSYFIFGFCQAVTGYMTWVFVRQESFRVERADYPHIGENPRRLVAYFSRMGYVKKQAFEEANRSGAQLYEIRAAERTEGTAGFWWCGRYGMHRWAMPIEAIGIDLTAHDHVTICTPIWVFALASPVREFCRLAAGSIREADYILVHHTRGRYASVAREMDALLGLENSPFRSVRCHTGRFSECMPKGVKI